MYTPLKYLIPGFGEYNYRSQIVAMTLKTDSLEKAMEDKALWLHNFTNILTGKIDTTKPRTVPKRSFKKEDINLNEVSEEEKSLRKDVQEDDNYSLNYKHGEKKEIEQGLSQFHFFPPLNGYVTDDFDPKKEHFGIDIVSKQDEPVKATLEGTVISTSWTLTTGYVIAIQHSNELVSFYKHNSKLLKKEGTFVKAGDVIAMVGNSGEITTGPHLHFELWYKGKSVNPKNYIIF
jgi:murein DD-endopeptidase MepM/ murein hydrolase activator NlpD